MRSLRRWARIDMADRVTIGVTLVMTVLSAANIGVSGFTLDTRERLVAVEAKTSFLEKAESRIVAEIKANQKSATDRYIDLLKEIRAK